MVLSQGFAENLVWTEGFIFIKGFIHVHVQYYTWSQNQLASQAKLNYEMKVFKTADVSHTVE